MAKEAIRIGLDKKPDIQAKLNDRKNHSETRREQILASYYLRHRLDQMKEINDKEIENYYLTHKDEFNLPERAKVRRVFFSSEKEALLAQSKLKKGITFENISEQRKSDSLWLYRKDSHSKLEQIAFILSQGEVSDIFETKTGYCLLKVEDKEPPTIRSLEASREAIKVKLKGKQRRDLLNQIKQGLRKNITITINHSAILLHNRVVSLQTQP